MAVSAFALSTPEAEADRPLMSEASLLYLASKALSLKTQKPQGNCEEGEVSVVHALIKRFKKFISHHGNS